jgi:hypothetical protein
MCGEAFVYASKRFGDKVANRAALEEAAADKEPGSVRIEGRMNLFNIVWCGLDAHAQGPLGRGLGKLHCGVVATRVQT